MPAVHALERLAFSGLGSGLECYDKNELPILGIANLFIGYTDVATEVWPVRAYHRLCAWAAATIVDAL